MGCSLPPASSFRQRLLATAPADVPSSQVAALSAFCREVPEIERGYVCAVSIEREGAEPEQRLRFCVKLHSSVSEPGDSRELRQRLFPRFASACPEAARSLGFGVMADRALPAWEAKALCIYTS